MSNITTPGKMTIIEFGDKLQFYPGSVKLSNSLEPGKVYHFEVDHNFGTMELRPTGKLKIPEKLYDFEQKFREQVLAILRNPTSNMNVGVLLEGYKGQGKSVIAKQLAIESGLPVIVINGMIPKIADFTKFLSEIHQDYVLFIDEFEKFFSETDHPENKFHTQDSFLTFLDGAFGLDHKRLVIFTSNKEIGDKFINRPSRIRYYKKFNFMKKQVFDAIVADKLENQEHKKDLENNLDIPSCTIDILTTIIDEMNVHKKKYSEFKEFFNHKERKITYSKYRKEDDGTWKFVEDIKSNKEIGVEDEYAKNLIGWHSTILMNDGETIIFEMEDDIDPDDDKSDTKKYTFKLIKQDWEKFKLAF